MQGITTVYKNEEMIHLEPLHQWNFFNTHRKALLLSITMISIILIVGCLVDQLLPTDASMGSIFDPLPTYKNGLGAVNGYAYSSSGMPALGTIVIAVGQDSLTKTTSTDLNQEGKYVFQDLHPGKYVIVADFPDGTYKVLNNIQVEPKIKANRFPFNSSIDFQTI